MIMQLLFCFYVFLKQFYIRYSGKLGYADIFFIIVFLLSIGQSLRKKTLLKDLKRDGYFYLFSSLCCLVNGVYYLILGNGDLITYSMYWLFNCAVVFCFRKLQRENGFNDKLALTFQINIVTQLIVYILQKGRVFVELWGATRYMGTFFDPNQFAFFILTSLLFIYIHCFQNNKKIFWIFYCISVYLISLSKSTGGFIGIAILTLIIVLRFGYSFYKKYVISKKVKIGFAVLMCSTVLVSMLILIPGKDFNVRESDYTLLNRIQYKISIILDEGIEGFLIDRSALRIVKYPQYLIYGAGEGAASRFYSIGDLNEIHCTPLSILFCYGIVPTCILLLWIFKNSKKWNKNTLGANIALFTESLILLNIRQPFFWMLLMNESNKYDYDNAGKISLNKLQRKGHSK